MSATASTTEYFDFSATASTTLSFNFEITCLPWWEEQEKELYKDLSQQVHYDEHRKDLFRLSSEIPNSQEHKSRTLNQFIPGKNNFKGICSKRY